MKSPAYYSMRAEGTSPFVAPDPQPREPLSPCRRGCCWTPYGHSTVRDQFAAHDPKACHCHDEQRRSQALERAQRDGQPPRPGGYS